jgi:membrane fusion protein, protease secretion system
MKLIEHPSITTVPDAAPQVDTDTGKYSKLGWSMVLLGFGGFVAWAALAPLDKGVPLTGTVVKESHRKQVAHQTGGTVEQVLVKEGDTVKAGQVLVRLNGTQVRSQADIGRIQYLSARAMQVRLEAERDGAAAMALPPELSDPAGAAAADAQRTLFSARRAALRSELAAIDENMAGLKLQGAGLRATMESKKAQQLILKEQLVNVRALAAEGFVPRSRLQDLERSDAQLAGGIAEDSGNLGRTERQVAEMALRRIQREQDFQKDVRAQLSELQRESGALGSRLGALDAELAAIEVKAPVDGVVVGLTLFTSGGVVAPGARMMEVVPADDALVVEGRLPVNLVDKVHPGLPVELIFSAFNAGTTPRIGGEVTQVSADRLLDERSGEPYYKVLVKVSRAGAAQVRQSSLRVVAGMPVELFVRTGERTMLSYLFKPLLDRASTALAED